MVRRLPVLQNSPQTEPKLTVARAVGVAMGGVLLSWAVLLWGLSRFGRWGMATSFVLACALASGVAISRVDRRDVRRTAIWAAWLVVVTVWGIAWLGGALNEPMTALLALLVLVVLSGIGFGVGIAVLFWRRRLSAAPRR